MSLNQALVAKLEAIVGAEYVRTDRGDVDGEFRRSKEASDAMVGVRGLTAGAPLGGPLVGHPAGRGWWHRVLPTAVRSRSLAATTPLSCASSTSGALRCT